MYKDTRNENLKSALLRLNYGINKYKENKCTTVILGAGCSLGATQRDISTTGIMKQCLSKHGYTDFEDLTWENLYKKFVNIVWQGKGQKEQEILLRDKLDNISPSEGHMYLRELVENGYIHNIITTNFDMLLEGAFAGLSYNKRVGDGEYKVVGENPTFNLLKVHGDLENGKFRFSPDELMNLPEELQKDITEKTSGFLLVIGYRGQDIGLMNCLSTLNAFSVYWIDLNEVDLYDSYSTKHIYDFMKKRNSVCNFLYGKEFGDFQNIMCHLRTLVLNPSHDMIIKTKEFQIDGTWKNTWLIKSLLIYNRLYELFLDILNVSERLSANYNGTMAENLYTEYLHSYLYFFNDDKYNSPFLQLPYNEVSAMVLGIAIEVIARAFANNATEEEYFELLQKEYFRTFENQTTIEKTFWKSVKKLIGPGGEVSNTIRVDLTDNLSLESYDVPLDELCGLKNTLDFLSMLLFVPSQQDIILIPKSRKTLAESLQKITYEDSKIIIELRQIQQREYSELVSCYFNDLPEIYKESEKGTINEQQITFDSKWIKLHLKIADKNMETAIMTSFYNLCVERCKQTVDRFLNCGQQVSTHAELPLDIDLKRFITSDRTAMFIVGASGSGKTTSIHNIIRKMTASDTLSIVISPKNTSIEKSGLSLFLDNDTQTSESTILQNIHSALSSRKQFLLLVFDGLNEIGDSLEIQIYHYNKLMELADALNTNNCERIKLIITCRISAYQQYRNLSKRKPNFKYFFFNDKAEINIQENQDACYRVLPLKNDDKQSILKAYLADGMKNVQLSTETMGYAVSLLKEADTPLFISLISELVLNEKVSDKKENIYSLFTNVMLTRLNNTNVFLSRKIIYAYFKILCKSTQSKVQVTKYKLMDEIEIQYHEKIENSILQLVDVNILFQGTASQNVIRFAHDRIEEFFFQEYIREYEFDDSFDFNKIIDLASQNMIYYNGMARYLLNLMENQELERYKQLILTFAIYYRDIISKLLIETLAHSKKIKKNIEYLLNVRDFNNSKRILSTLFHGLDISLQVYSSLTIDSGKIINELLSLSTGTLLSKENYKTLQYFKSKQYYYTNDFEKALECVNSAISFYEHEEISLEVTKMRIHYSVILMELGYSKKTISILEKEYNYYKNISDYNMMLEIGIELGRAYNHSGQTTITLALYDELLQIENINSYALARIYEQKANVLNNIMYSELDYGFSVPKSVTREVKEYVEQLYAEAIVLYENSMDILLNTDELFTYSGVVPEKINTYISYSFSISPVGIQECETLLQETDALFQNLTTPFKTDFYLSWAYFCEYKGELQCAEEYIKKALENAEKMNIKNKEAKCYVFFSQFAYRRTFHISDETEKQKWCKQGLACIAKALHYYNNHTVLENNIVVTDILKLKKILEEGLI